jgi:hypothetical protein
MDRSGIVGSQRRKCAETWWVRDAVVLALDRGDLVPWRREEQRSQSTADLSLHVTMLRQVDSRV